MKEMETWDVPFNEPFPFPVVALILGRDLFSPSKKLYEGGSLPAADERTGAGRISCQHHCLFYTLHTPGESWNTRETTSTFLVIRGAPRASLGLFKNWHFTKKSKTAGIKYFLLCLLQTGKRPCRLIWLVCAEVHNGEGRDWRGDSSQHYSAFHNYQTMIISEKEIPFI